MRVHGTMYEPGFGSWNAGAAWVKYSGGGGACGSGDWANEGFGWLHGWELVTGGGRWSPGYNWGAGTDIVVRSFMVELLRGRAYG